MEKFDRLISLGTDCSVGLAFKGLEIKEETYPFDWTVSHYRWLRAQMEERLPWPVDGSALTIHRESEPYIVADEPAGIFYYHDFTPGESVESELAEVAARYRRRADRLREVMDSGQRLLLVRAYRGGDEPTSGGTTADIEALAEIIETRFPACDFRIDMLYSQDGPEPRHPRVRRLRLPIDRQRFKRAVVQYVRENDPRLAVAGVG